MRHALDKVRIETEAMARSHAQLVHSVRKEIESPLSDLMARSENVRRPAQVAVTKLYKHKQMQMQYVQRSREKYEQDCTKINAYTAQSNLVQGKELDKLMGKLERVQATVGQNDKDYQSYVRALQDTTYKWNSEWKSFLDVCQDVEEERQEFLKTNLWSFANAISSVCVTDDEACERVRVSLEDCDSMRDVEGFVREFGTGAAIPAAPEYINYAQGQAQPQDEPVSAAQFHRLSTRMSDVLPPLSTGTPVPSGATPSLLGATPGFGATPGLGATPSIGGTPSMGGTPNLDTPRSNSRAMRRTPPPQSLEPIARTPPPSTSNRNSMFSPGAPPLSRMESQLKQPRQPTVRQAPATQAPAAQVPMAQAPVTQYDTQPRTSYASGGAPAPAPAASLAAAPAAAPAQPANLDESDDPIAKALANLRMHQSRKSPAPNSRPTSVVQPAAPAQAQAQAQAPVQPMAQAPPPPQPVQDVRQGPMPGAPPADVRPVVDPRLQQRPLSPAAAFMNPPARSTSPIPVEQVMSQYGQSFPSERRLSANAPNRAAYSSQGAQPPRSNTPGGITLDARGAVTQNQMAENYNPPAGSNVPPAAPTNRPPTGQYSEAGEPILFYVKALYDYAASMPEEFSFTAGDIIAVTHTEPDGWWQGELLDEARRVPGANTFPSNFVVLLM